MDLTRLPVSPQAPASGPVNVEHVVGLAVRVRLFPSSLWYLFFSSLPACPARDPGDQTELEWGSSYMN